MVEAVVALAVGVIALQSGGGGEPAAGPQQDGGGAPVEVGSGGTLGGEGAAAADEERASRRLAELRRKVAFPVFVPTEVPEGLTPNLPAGGAHPADYVRITYRTADGLTGLSVLNGPGGSGLAADPRKRVNPVRIRGGITAYFIPNQPEFGGPILWWEEAGAYVALSGPTLTREELVAIAASLSPEAELGP